ncbi:MAG: LPS export ABC transporter periplasmic protein LptC, partial [Planctomycetota bacterium]
IIIIISSLHTQFSYSEPEQILTNWSYPHYQNNQLVWEAKGKTAVVREDEFIISVFELTYYIQPLSTTSPSEITKKETLRIRADMAILKKQQQIASLHENIIVKRTSEPANELDETMQTQTLSINMANKTFSTDSPITITRTDLLVKSKGCNGTLNFDSVSFASNIETIMKDCNSNSFSLGTIFSPKSRMDFEELNKTPSVITITSEGPMSIEKILPQGIPLTSSSKQTNQKITLQNKVVVNSFTRKSPAPIRMKLQAEKVAMILSRRENPVTKRNSTYLMNLTATDNVNIDDALQSAQCSSLIYDEVMGSIILKGKEQVLATIIKPLNPISNTGQTGNNSYINLSAQTIKIQTEKDRLILIGRKEIVFSDGSFYAPPQPISGTEVVITNTPTISDTPSTSSNGKFSNKIQITADNNALVSFDENRMYMENKVRIFQRVKPYNSSQEPYLKTQIQCDKLTISWNPLENSLQKIRAENNVIILSNDGGEVGGKILEWSPVLLQINIKSPHIVKIRDKNKLMEADEITITTNPQGDWKKIETKNNNGGEIKINPPDKE